MPVLRLTSCVSKNVLFIRQDHQKGMQYRIPYSTVQYSTVQYSTVQCSAVLCSAERYSAELLKDLRSPPNLSISVSQRNAIIRITTNYCSETIIRILNLILGRLRKSGLSKYVLWLCAMPVPMTITMTMKNNGYDYDYYYVYD